MKSYVQKLKEEHPDHWRSSSVPTDFALCCIADAIVEAAKIISLALFPEGEEIEDLKMKQKFEGGMIPDPTETEDEQDKDKLRIRIRELRSALGHAAHQMERVMNGQMLPEELGPHIRDARTIVENRDVKKII